MTSLPTLRARRGFTLVELLIVMVLLGLIGSAITTVIVRQERFYRGANQIIDTRGQIRQAAAILPIELRGLSSVGGDFLSIGPQQLEFRAPIGTSIVCQVVAVSGGQPTQVALPPTGLNSRQVLTSFLNDPAPGDDVFVFDDGPQDHSGDDQWRLATITNPMPAAVTGTYCLPTTGFTRVADAGLTRKIIPLTATTSTTVKTGAPLRFARRVRYRLYQASDTKWYLGYEQYKQGAWEGMQPVSGPYLAGDAANAADRGLEFRYFTQAGVEVTALPSAQPIARVDVVVRGETGQAVQLSGTAPTRRYRDSLNVSIAIRNWQ